jgi:molecular chaperone HscA
MALFQIAEPGESAAPHEHKLAIGIDLGTTNSLVATVRSGIAVCLSDDQGRPLLPSVVRYHADGSTDVGFGAQTKQAVDPRNTIISVKRFMGRGLKDIAHVESMPYDFIEAPGMVKVKTIAGIKSPVEVSAEILKSLKTRAETALAGDLVGAVITVPAYFDDAQRQATKDAARLAGLNVLRLLNEPTAAAIAYGLDNAAEGVYAVYDLGGGTFDISILKLTKGVFEVLSTGGDSALGGDDFDHRIFCWVIEQAKLQPLSPEDGRLLMMRCREAKEYLTNNPEAPITARLSTGEVIDTKLDVATFASIAQTLISKTMQPVKKSLRDAGLRAEDIKGVVMVGGATRMPQVQKAVGDFFRQEPLTNLDPDKVVALGAATQANLLVGNKTGKDDAINRALKEAVVEAQRMIEATEAAMKEDPHLLNEAETAKITVTIAKLAESMQGTNRRLINIAMDDLGFETQEFAHRRMDQSIKKVLSGRKVDDIKMGEDA